MRLGWGAQGLPSGVLAGLGLRAGVLWVCAWEGRLGVDAAPCLKFLPGALGAPRVPRPALSLSYLLLQFL